MLILGKKKGLKKFYLRKLEKEQIKEDEKKAEITEI